MQDMTCQSCKQNVPLNKFIDGVCFKCAEKPIEKPRKTKLTKN